MAFIQPDDDFSESIFLDCLYGKNVQIFLLGGFKLIGEFHGHDDKSIFLKRNNEDQIVYKNAIPSISQTSHKNYTRD